MLTGFVGTCPTAARDSHLVRQRRRPLRVYPGARSDTNMQEHVRDLPTGSLHVVSEVGKMTLTKKFVFHPERY